MAAEQLEELPADVAEVIRYLTGLVIAAEKLVEAANAARTALAGYTSAAHAIRLLDEAIPACREAGK